MIKPPTFKTGNASIRKALNDVAEYARKHGVNPAGAPGWSTSADGYVPPGGETEGETAAAALVWQLIIEDSESGEVSINCGTILKDAADLSETFEIANKDSIFTVGSGDKIFLKITNTFVGGEFVTNIFLEKDNTWEDYPARYEVTGQNADAQFAAYYYPLYYFDDIADDNSITIIPEEVYAHRVCENSNFELIWAIYQKGTDAALTVPKLIPSHSPLPPA